MRPSVTYTPCATYLRGGNGNIIVFTQFEEGCLLSETCNDVESGDESNDNSIIPTLLGEEEIDVMDYGDDSDHDLICTDMLEDIFYGSQSHLKVNRR